MRELSELRPFRCRLSFEEIERKRKASFACLLAYLAVLFFFSFRLFLTLYKILPGGGL